MARGRSVEVKRHRKSMARGRSVEVKRHRKSMARGRSVKVKRHRKSMTCGRSVEVRRQDINGLRKISGSQETQEINGLWKSKDIVSQMSSENKALKLRVKRRENSKTLFYTNNCCLGSVNSCERKRERGWGGGGVGQR